MKNKIQTLLLALMTFGAVCHASAQGTAFTYQGRLDDAGQCANGYFDLQFQLFSSSTGGSALYTSTTSTSDVLVTNGLFTVSIDFGSGVFNGATYYLQTGVRTNGSSAAYAELAPRVQIMPAPYAIYAESSPASTLVTDPGTENFFSGPSAGNQTLIGAHNTAVGYSALTDITSGIYNTAAGDSALLYDQSGGNNTAYGVYALKYNVSGGGNTAIGADAVAYNSTADFNVGVGLGAVENNATGSNNVGIGTYALGNMTSDNDLVAVGYQALRNDNAGGGLFNSSGNVAVGYECMESNTVGSANTAVGWLTLGQNVGGYNNTAFGWAALSGCASGENNIAVGLLAGGSYTGSESGNIDIGNSGTAGENNIIHLGGSQTDTYFAGNLHGVAALGIDQTGTYGANAGNVTANALTFGTGPSGSGEGIASQRTSGANQFDLALYTGFHPRLTVLANGNVGIGTSSPSSLLQVAGAISCVSITITSDRNAKEDFASVDPRSVLEKVSSLPVTEWKYKQDNAGLKHIGPMAQDFQAAFGLNGADNTHISVVDEGGVALAAIQGLNQKLEEQNAELRQQNDSLSQRLNDLARVVQSLAARK